MVRKSAMHGESGYARVEGDAYITPVWVTEILLRHVRFAGGIWEPAAADGQMARVLARRYKVVASDIEPEPPGCTRRLDFFEHDLMSTRRNVRHVVTNPPYGRAVEFIERGLEVTQRTGGKVAMLMRNEFDSGSTRTHLFADCPEFAMKLALTRRPRWFPGEGPSPRHNFSWFVWDWRHDGPPTLAWDR